MAWALAAVALAYVGGNLLFGVRISKREVDQLIRTHLPIGIDKMEVLRFLDSRGWDHSGVENTSELERSFDPNIIEYRAAQVIRVRIQNVGPGCVDLGFLEIGFAFNKQGKLTLYRVEQIGPELP